MLAAALTIAAVTVLLASILGAPVSLHPIVDAVSPRTDLQPRRTDEPVTDAPARAPVVANTSPVQNTDLAVVDQSVTSTVVPQQPQAPEQAPSEPILPVIATATYPSQSTGKANSARRATGAHGLTILQIGDSHTAADFFTGELRQRLQERYGDGGAGYLPAGRPHIGIRSSALKVSASAGWSYQAIQKSDNVAQFWLSGFNAVANAAGETLGFSSEKSAVFDSIEIEVVCQPDGGKIEISLDGSVKASFDLNAKAVQPLVLRLTPEGGTGDRFRKMEIRTQNEGAVNIASVGVYNRRAGISYNNIGYPGASVDLVNKFNRTLMEDDLRRLDPQIVVLAFGTNEAANKNLDPDRYRRNYEKAVERITSVLPNARLVLIGPPDGAERSGHCAGRPSSEVICRPNQYDGSTPPDTAQQDDCNWRQLAKLGMVRGIISKLAEQRGFAYWNWASIMPQACGAHIWASDTPALMTPDHIHFTIAGYNKGADKFLTTLTAVIDELQAKTNLAVGERTSR